MLPETSRLANKAASAEMREKHHILILEAISALKCAIGEQIAIQAKMDYHAVMRRMKELLVAGKIYNTLETGLTSKGRKANRYAIRTPETVIPTPEKHYMEGQTTAGDFAAMLTQKSENHQKEKEKIVSYRTQELF